MCSTLFLYISLPLFRMTTMWNFQKLLSYTFFGRNVVRVVVEPFFSLPLIFTLHWWLLAFLILSPLLQNFLVVLPTKKCLLCYFLGELRWPAAYFLLFSVFLFLYIPNLWTSTLNTLDIMDKETISAVRFRLYWLFSCLCFTRRGWQCDFTPK